MALSPDRAARFDVTKLAPMIEAVHERLAGVIIERLPWADFITRYDRPGTLFYLDPPYFGSEGDYGRDLFDRSQFELMAQQLRGVKGRFVLSLNDHPEVRRIFAGLRLSRGAAELHRGRRGPREIGGRGDHYQLTGQGGGGPGEVRRRCRSDQIVSSNCKRPCGNIEIESNMSRKNYTFYKKTRKKTFSHMQ